MAACQNNPQLFNEFERVSSKLTMSLTRVILEYEKEGNKEMANYYRAKAQKWDAGYRALKGMP